MATFEPVYRATVYGTDDVTPLAPHTNAPHAESFQVATKQGVVGYQPYLDWPRGRRGKIDPFDRKLDTGELTLRIFDPRTTMPAGGNFQRWATAFFGDAKGRAQLPGRLVKVEESTDGGSTWSPYFTGRIHAPSVDERLWLTLVVRDRAEELKRECFVGEPHSSVAYAAPVAILPYGPSQDYNAFEAVPAIPAKVKTWSETGFGSGQYLEIDMGAVKKTPGSIDLVTVGEALADLTSDRPTRNADGTYEPHAKIEVEVTSGATTGRFRLAVHRVEKKNINGFLSTKREEKGQDEVVLALTVGITEVDASDPDHMTAPLDGTAVDMRLIPVGEPTEEAPLYIDDVHPVQLVADILDGKFGRMNADGTIKQSIPRDTTAFDALIADTSIPKARFAIPEKFEINEFIEKHVALAFNLGYRIDEQGRVVMVDMRPPTSVPGTTIGQEDIDPARAPSWGTDLDTAVSTVQITYYSDELMPEGARVSFMPFGTPSIGDPGFRGYTWIETRSHIWEQLDITSPALAGAKPLKIDALGYRFAGGVLSFLDGVNESALVFLRVSALAEQYRQWLTSGVVTARLLCRRTATVNAVKPGTFVVVDVDELPDPATNLRGGPRVMLCVERTERGLPVDLVLVDMGPNSVAVAPSIGSLALVIGEESHAFQVDVTLNGDAEPAVIHFAVTDTGVTTRPADSDAAWTFGARVTASGTYIISGLPSGKRIWPRARSEPAGETGAKLASGWVYPSSPARVDTSGIGAPSSLAAVAGYPTGTEHKVTFTPASSLFLTKVFLDDVRIETLPAGAKLVHLRSLAASTAYNLDLRHVDPATNSKSSKTRHSFTTTGTAAVAPAVKGIAILVGEAG